LPRLLQASELRDNPISLGAQCPLEDGAAPCHETYAPPSATGEWRGFDPTQVIEAHSQAVQARERGTRKSTFESAGLRIVDTDDGTTISRDGIFRLQILEAGDGFRFINYLNGYGARNNANARLDASDAERLGRNLISDFDLAPLGPDEELTFLGTRYAHFTGNASDPGDRVVGTRAYFGRKVDGIPVIGEGSRIVIEFAHGVRVLDVNWSGLERSGTQQVRAGAPEIVRRVESQRASLGLSGVPFESLDAMCGLYDGGTRSGASELALTCLTRDRSLADASEMTTSIREAGAQNVDSSEQGLRVAETDKGCSATPLGGGPDTRRALHLIALLACGALFRRRRARWLARIFVLLAVPIMLLQTQTVSAVSGVADMNYYMYRSYAAGTDLESFSPVQYENREDWKDEMYDILDCGTACLSASSDLSTWLYDTSSNFLGLNADIILVATHGEEGQATGVNFNVRMSDYEDDATWARNIEPASTDTDAEIAMWQVCHSQATDNTSMWYGWRNLHRKGLLVSAGCWGTTGSNLCSMETTGVNSTFNELGDSIADSEQSIYDAWVDAHDLLFGTAGGQDVSIFGLGAKSANNCDNRARDVSFQNRLNYTFYNYGHDESISGSYELCGYYWTNL
jgi:hypothetical protein